MQYTEIIMPPNMLIDVRWYTLKHIFHLKYEIKKMLKNRVHVLALFIIFIFIIISG